MTTIKAMSPWINVLDPGFDLHLRQDLVAEAFEVRKPTKDGPLTSVELYDAKRELVAQFFGERERDRPEANAWREVVAAISNRQDVDELVRSDLDGERRSAETDIPPAFGRPRCARRRQGCIV